MVNHTRLDCVLGAASGMRQAVAQALHHAAHRRAFGRELVDQPLMRNVLADLAVESEAATTLAIRLAAAYDATDRARRRPARGRVRPARHRGREVLGVQAPTRARRGGARVPRRQRVRRGVDHAAPAPRVAVERDLGGIGQRHLPRRPARDGPRQPASVDAFREEVLAAAGADPRFDAHCRRLDAMLADPDDLEARARSDRRGDGARAPGVAADPRRIDRGRRRVLRRPRSTRTRLARVYGTLPAGVDVAAIIGRGPSDRVA